MDNSISRIFRQKNPIYVSFMEGEILNLYMYVVLICIYIYTCVITYIYVHILLNIYTSGRMYF
jgi:hypothetical protein